MNKIRPGVEDPYCFICNGTGYTRSFHTTAGTMFKGGGNCWHHTSDCDPEGCARGCEISDTEEPCNEYEETTRSVHPDWIARGVHFCICGWPQHDHDLEQVQCV